MIMFNLVAVDQNEVNVARQMLVSQIKPGDILCRRKDHLSREDHDLKVVKKYTAGKVSFDVETPSGRTERWYSTQLSASGYDIVVRDGQVIGTFFCKYW